MTGETRLAIGLCPAGDGEDFHGLDCSGDLRLLLARSDTSAEERLELCLLAAERLEAFLPFPPRAATLAERAAAWSHTHVSGIRRVLDEVRGHAEMLVSATDSDEEEVVPHMAGATPGRSFLKARAQLHARNRARSAALDRILPSDVSKMELSSHAASATTGMVLLMPQRDMTSLAMRLEAATAPGIRLQSSGPWPVFAHSQSLLRCAERRE